MRALIKGYLKTSEELVKLLGITNKDDKMYPNYSKKSPPYLVLKIRPDERGKVKTEEVEIKIIDKNINNQEKIQELVLGLMDFGETNKHYSNGENILLTSHLTGSGELEYEDIGLIEKTLTFEVKWR